LYRNSWRGYLGIPRQGKARKEQLYNMRTLSVSARTATHHSTGTELSAIGDDEMEIGAGQHGETGADRMKLMTADETAEIMLARSLEDLEVKPGEEPLV